MTSAWTSWTQWCSLNHCPYSCLSLAFLTQLGCPIFGPSVDWIGSSSSSKKALNSLVGGVLLALIRIELCLLSLSACFGPLTSCTSSPSSPCCSQILSFYYRYDPKIMYRLRRHTFSHPHSITHYHLIVNYLLFFLFLIFCGLSILVCPLASASKPHS